MTETGPARSSSGIGPQRQRPLASTGEREQGVAQMSLPPHRGDVAMQRRRQTKHNAPSIWSSARA